MLNRQKTELSFMHVLLVGAFVLSFFIFKPFLYVLILAVVFATIFDPVHKKILLLSGDKKALSAFLTSILVLIIVIVPVAFFSIKIFDEATELYAFLITNGGVTTVSQFVGTYIQHALRFLPVTVDFSGDLNQYLKQAAVWLLQNIGPFFADVFKAFLDIFIFLAALYYLFKDGHTLRASLISLSPLKESYNKTIFHKLALSVNSILKGSLAVACSQGFLTSIGFLIFGIPNVVLWGACSAVASLVPGVGTALVLVPAVAYLVLNGEFFAAFGLLLWAIFVVGLIDNLIGPVLEARGMKVHSFLILLSILGGISFFGPLGFILGPLVLSLLFVFIDIYSAVTKETLK